jgi:hypothetical protein
MRQFRFGNVPQSFSAHYCFSESIREVDREIQITTNGECYFISLFEFDLEIRVELTHEFGVILQKIFERVGKLPDMEQKQEMYLTLPYQIIDALIKHTNDWMYTQEIIRAIVLKTQQRTKKKNKKKIQKRLQKLLGLYVPHDQPY